ncbi:MAG: hypothetical protein U1E14_08780 [Geminicoccaceae bacterium]
MISDLFGTIGIAALAVILVQVVVALTFGFTALIYGALILTVVMFIVLLAICRGTGVAEETD